MKSAKISKLGLLICPYCFRTIWIPDNTYVLAGVFKCTLVGCQKLFHVTKASAEKVNKATTKRSDKPQRGRPKKFVSMVDKNEHEQHLRKMGVKEPELTECMKRFSNILE